MAENQISQNMQMAGGLLQDMIMEEAIKDKTEQVQKEMEEKQMAQIREQTGYDEKEDDEGLEDDDSDFDDDGIMQSIRE